MEHEWTPIRQAALGVIEIAPEVIEVIAGIAATEIVGIKGMSGGFVSGMQERLGRKNRRQGVSVTMDGHDVTVDVYVIVTYGYSIPRVANDLKRNVKRLIETMTSLSVQSVDVYVTDVWRG